MNAHSGLKSRIARALAAHAVRVAHPDHAEWATAMSHELEHLPRDASALSWALGCVFVSYRGRLRAMTRLPDLLDEALLAITLICLAPASLNFLTVAISTILGEPPFIMPSLPYTFLQADLLYGSAALIGPVGLAATLWTLWSPRHRPGTVLMVLLWTLAAWGFFTFRLTAQYHPSLTMNIVLMPALGAAMLQTLDARRRWLAGVIP